MPKILLFRVAGELSGRLVQDAQTTHGGSGGPVFDASGKVIGVNFAGLSGFAGSNFAVPIARAAKLIRP
jgi:serine protease Do